jgi:hypothetical protein
VLSWKTPLLYLLPLSRMKCKPGSLNSKEQSWFIFLKALIVIEIDISYGIDSDPDWYFSRHWQWLRMIFLETLWVIVIDISQHVQDQYYLTRQEQSRLIFLKMLRAIKIKIYIFWEVKRSFYKLSVISWVLRLHFQIIDWDNSIKTSKNEVDFSLD